MKDRCIIGFSCLTGAIDWIAVTELNTGGGDRVCLRGVEITVVGGLSLLGVVLKSLLGIVTVWRWCRGSSDEIGF